MGSQIALSYKPKLVSEEPNKPRRSEKHPNYWRPSDSGRAMREEKRAALNQQRSHNTTCWAPTPKTVSAGTALWVAILRGGT